MKDYVLELAAKKTGYNDKFNTVREYLQAYVLRIMHDEGVFRTTAFLGGTALRFLYELPRFSEDLDFSIVKAGDYTFVALIKKLKAELVAAGYSVDVVYNDQKTVHHAFIKFEKLLYEARLSPLASQKFSIKIEIDMKPPEGAILETKIVNKFFPIAFLSYDVSSLFAGKSHALLSRKYTKGRDYFDLGWYLSRWKDICPNLALLSNALRQTDWKGDMPSAANWRGFLANVVERADWQAVTKDVENFLENPKDLAVFNRENILNLLNA